MNRQILVVTVFGLVLGLAGCTDHPDAADAAAEHMVETTPEDTVTEMTQEPTAAEEVNPLLAESTLPYGLPPFDQIRSEHFLPALRQAIAEHRAEIGVIAGNHEPPTFENTIVALERAGLTLARINRIFSNLSGANTDDVLQDTRRELAPEFAAHRDYILLNPDLFERVSAVYEARGHLDLDDEMQRLVERYYRDFVRSGAALTEPQQARLKEINARLAELGAKFSEQVLAEVNDSAVLVDSADELIGLSPAAVRAAADGAAAAGHAGGYRIALLNTTGQPPLASLANRALRERIHRASVERGSRGGTHDARGVVAETIRLRTERAQLLGYATHADFIMEEQTAGNVGAVNRMLADLAPFALRNAQQEAASMQALINETEETPFVMAAWDWAYYAERVRQANYEVDEDEVRPYFELNSVLENGVFYSANQLFGITFTARPDLPVYHPDVQIYEVAEADGTPIGLFIADWYARPSKRGGAWMNSYVVRSGLLGGMPVVGNHLNITKPADGEPTLMTWDEVNTMFHEFGHAVHGLFSDVHYPRFAATAVPRDFVEYPSQVYEMWADWPEVLENYALHHETGEPIPRDLLDRVLEAQQFNEGFRTLEYLAAALLDQAWHQIADVDQVPDADGVLDFEAAALEAAGVAYDLVPPRYRTTYFSHVMTHFLSGVSAGMANYSAGYYSYIWSEVLDADSVEWFRENGGMTRDNGSHYRNTILSKGGSIEAMDLYRQFAGRDPSIQPLLERRGLVD